MKYEFSAIDLWPYLLISFSFLFCWLNKLKSASTIIFLLLFVFCALRYDVGWDYTEYVKQIKNGYSDNLVDARYEPISAFIFKISMYLKFYPFVFIIFSLLTLYLVYISINKYSTNKIISWLVYFSMPLFFFASLSTIRQSLATAIVFYSYKFAKDKKYFYFILTIILASFIHISALMGFLLLPIILFPLNRKTSLIFFLTSFLLSKQVLNLLTSISSNFIVISKIQSYIEVETLGTTSLQYLYYMIAIFNLVFYNSLVRSDISNKYYISITTFGVVIFNILSFEPISATRISAFFLLYWVYLIPSYSNMFLPKYRRVFEVIIIFILLSLSFYYLSMYLKAYENNTLEKVSFLPYKFWWNYL